MQNLGSHLAEQAHPYDSTGKQAKEKANVDSGPTEGRQTRSLC